MSKTVNKRWLKDKDGTLIAPKTLSSQVINNDGKSLYDTLKELGDLIDTNVDAIKALETVASSKADKIHSHEIDDVNGLQVALDEIQVALDEINEEISQPTVQFITWEVGD